MAPPATLSPDEVMLLRCYRRLKATGREFRLDVLGLARTPAPLVELHSTEFLRMPMEPAPSLHEAVD